MQNNNTCEKYKHIIELYLNSTKKDLSYEYTNTTFPLAWNDDPNLFLKLLCHIRNPKNKDGNKELAYRMLRFLKDNFPKTYNENIMKISKEYGCLKDLLVMAKYEMRDDSSNIELNLFAELLKYDLTQENPSLAVKWAPRENCKDKLLCYKLANILFPNQKNCLELYRKNILNVLSKKITIVEQLMCDNKWDEIDYHKLPKYALMKYGKQTVNNKFYNKWSWKIEDDIINGAFLRHDKVKYADFLKKKQSGNYQYIDQNNIQKNNLFAILDRYEIRANLMEIFVKINLDTTIDNQILNMDYSNNEVDDLFDEKIEEAKQRIKNKISQEKKTEIIDLSPEISDNEWILLE
jgi:hypothetical protein